MRQGKKKKTEGKKEEKKKTEERKKENVFFERFSPYAKMYNNIYFDSLDGICYMMNLGSTNTTESNCFLLQKYINKK